MSNRNWQIGFARLSRDGINFDIKWYAICYVVSYAVINYLAKRDIKKMRLNITEYEFDTLAEVSFVSGLIGGRLWYLVYRYIEYGIPFTYKPFHVWEGGMAYQGGLLLGVAGGVTYLLLRRRQKLLGRMLDIVTSKLPLGILLGRLGNYANEEFMNLVFGIPSCLFSSITEGLIPYIILNHTFNFKKHEYLSTAMFFILYSVIRFLNDFYREEEAYKFLFLELKFSQYVCIGIFCATLAAVAFRYVLRLSRDD